MCVCCMDFVSAGKNTLLLYVTVCEKVVPRLNKHDDVIEWNFMKSAPPEMKSWLRPCPDVYVRCNLKIERPASEEAVKFFETLNCYLSTFCCYIEPFSSA